MEVIIKRMNLRSKCLSGQFAIVIGIKLKIKLSTIKKYELDEYVEEEQTFISLILAGRIIYRQKIRRSYS